MGVKLFKGDCLELMKQIGDKSIDLVLADLPYAKTHNHWDSLIPFDSLWEQYNRIIKDHGAIVLFGQTDFSAQLIMSNPKMFRYTLAWDKVRTTGFLNAKRMPLRRHEDILVFYKKLPTYNPQMVEGGEPSHSRGKKWAGKGNTQDDGYVYGVSTGYNNGYDDGYWDAIREIMENPDTYQHFTKALYPKHHKWIYDSPQYPLRYSHKQVFEKEND